MDKFRAIVVDDESSVCEAMKAILEIEGIDVTATTSSVGADDIDGKTLTTSLYRTLRCR